MKLKFAKKYIFFLILTLIVFFLICTLSTRTRFIQNLNQQPGNSKKINLTVKVKMPHPINRTVTNGRVQVSRQSDKKTFEIVDLNENGEAFFNLDPGNYLIQMQSGYTGKKEVNLTKNTTIDLEVLEIYR
jgi:hypothetical protein